MTLVRILGQVVLSGLGWNQKFCKSVSATECLQPPGYNVRLVHNWAFHSMVSVRKLNTSPTLGRRATIGLLLPPLLSARGAFAQTPDVQDCLFADPHELSISAECRRDPARLRNEPEILAAVAAVGVTASEVEFWGCGTGSFWTTKLAKFRITYPVAQGRSTDEYLAPLIHELCHVLQISNAGSVSALRASVQNSSERIELGADFLTGVLFRNFLPGLNRGLFQRSSDLLGSYKSDLPRKYGSPANRVAAFRMGYFYNRNGSSLVEVHDAFQADIFPQVQLLK